MKRFLSLFLVIAFFLNTFGSSALAAGNNNGINTGNNAGLNGANAVNISRNPGIGKWYFNDENSFGIVALVINKTAGTSAIITIDNAVEVKHEVSSISFDPSGVIKIESDLGQFSINASKNQITVTGEDGSFSGIRKGARPPAPTNPITSFTSPSSTDSTQPQPPTGTNINPPAQMGASNPSGPGAITGTTSNTQPTNTINVQTSNSGDQQQNMGLPNPPEPSTITQPTDPGLQPPNKDIKPKPPQLPPLPDLGMGNGGGSSNIPNAPGGNFGLSGNMQSPVNASIGGIDPINPSTTAPPPSDISVGRPSTINNNGNASLGTTTNPPVNTTNGPIVLPGIGMGQLPSSVSTTGSTNTPPGMSIIPPPAPQASPQVGGTYNGPPPSFPLPPPPQDNTTFPANPPYNPGKPPAGGVAAITGTGSIGRPAGNPTAGIVGGINGVINNLLPPPQPPGINPGSNGRVSDSTINAAAAIGAGAVGGATVPLEPQPLPLGTRGSGRVVLPGGGTEQTLSPSGVKTRGINIPVGKIDPITGEISSSPSKSNEVNEVKKVKKK